MISIGDAISLLNAFWTTYKGLKSNREECRKFHHHAQTILGRMAQECGDDPPKALQKRLAIFTDTLIGLTATIEDVKRSSILKQIFMTSDISSLITRAYEDIESAARELQLGVQFDIHRAQLENQETQRLDSERAARAFEDVLTNEGTILRELAEHRIEMREAILFIRKNLSRTPPGQRRVLEQGMHILQRRSRDRLSGLQVPDEFIITSLEIVVHRHLRLGFGGFAEVYEAAWNNVKVAVKIFPKGVMPGVLEREFKVWSRLRHPNIVEFFGACSFANPPFFVCALKTNGDVMSYLQRCPDTNRTKLLHDASLGLVYLHSRNIVHGDLKGTNILVDERGQACLADFGLSEIKVTTSTVGSPSALVQSVPTFGTARWMSPETMMGGQVTRRSDVYSFAMTMYEVYTSTVPFANVPDVLLPTIAYDRRIRPTRPEDGAAVGLDDQVWTLIVHSWAHKPSQRPQAAQIAEKLGALATSASYWQAAGEDHQDQEFYDDILPTEMFISVAFPTPYEHAELRKNGPSRVRVNL